MELTPTSVGGVAPTYLATHAKRFSSPFVEGDRGGFALAESRIKSKSPVAPFCKGGEAIAQTRHDREHVDLLSRRGRSPDLPTSVLLCGRRPTADPRYEVLGGQCPPYLDGTQCDSSNQQ